MGWTWNHTAGLMQLYPQLANSPVLLKSWPGFQKVVDDMRATGKLPPAPSGPDPSGPAAGGGGPGAGGVLPQRDADR